MPADGSIAHGCRSSARVRRPTGVTLGDAFRTSPRQTPPFLHTRAVVRRISPSPVPGVFRVEIISVSTAHGVPFPETQRPRLTNTEPASRPVVQALRPPVAGAFADPHARHAIVARRALSAQGAPGGGVVSAASATMLIAIVVSACAPLVLSRTITFNRYRPTVSVGGRSIRCVRK